MLNTVTCYVAAGAIYLRILFTVFMVHSLVNERKVSLSVSSHWMISMISKMDFVVL